MKIIEFILWQKREWDMNNKNVQAFFMLWFLFWLSMAIIAGLFHFSIGNTIPPGELPGYSVIENGSWS